MPDRQSRPAGRRTNRDDRVAGPGVIARIADRAIDNPATSGGLLVMALTATAIISNAMFLQNSRHPGPLFMTRPAPVIDGAGTAAPVPVPIPRARIEPPKPPLPREAPPAPAAASVAPSAPLPVAAPSLVADLQRILAARGLYQGTVDGVAGKRTRAAISAYQLVEGIPVTGEPTPAILERLKAAKPIPAAIADPPAPPPPAASVAPAPAVVAPPPAPPAASTTAPAPAPISTNPALPAAPAPVVNTAPPAPDPAAVEHERYLGVQNALNEIGYGPVPTNGAAGDETASAISRFELDNGLPITGKLSEPLVSRLVSIGAMKPL